MKMDDPRLSDPKDDKVEIMRVHKWLHDHLDFQTNVAIMCKHDGVSTDSAFSMMDSKLKEMIADYPGGIKQLGKDFTFYMTVMHHITEVLVMERLTGIMKGILEPKQDIASALDDMLGMKK